MGGERVGIVDKEEVDGGDGVKDRGEEREEGLFEVGFYE